MPAPSLPETCPAEEELAAFVHGDIPGRQARTLEAHAARCAPCRRILSALARVLSDGSVPPSDSRCTTLPVAATELDGELPIGGLVSRYRVLDWLGAGGMGSVYAAHDPELNRKVALKVLRHGISARGARLPLRDLLQREAQAMARLAHPNVVTVFDVGSVGDRVFLAMELIEGVTLGQWLRAEPRAPRDVLAAFVAAGTGLAAAHAAGLIHRDFKPDNVLVGDDGRICVTDFGLARFATVEPLEAAPPGAADARRGTGVVGTLAYMAPEQYTAGRADPRSDQFSFAVALYEAFHGERPFAVPRPTDDGWPAIRPLPARPRDSRIPRRVYPVLRRALSASPAERYPSMAAVLAALAPRPHRRRGRALVLGTVAAVVGTVAWTATRAIELQRAADQRTELVGRLRGLAPDLRSRLRGAHMMPLHDIQTARGQVSATMGYVEGVLTTRAGQDVRGIGEFVLGEGARALGDHDRALALLEAAWAAGERGPEIDAALGGELGASYERRFAELESTVEPARRDAARREIEQRYRDPAIVHLRAAVASGRASPAYLEALIAFHGHRFADASSRAHAAFVEAPTFYEASELDARAHDAAGHDLLAAGKRDAARAEFLVARQIFERVLAIGRSDDEAWLLDGDMIWNQAVALGDDQDQLRPQALTALHNAQQINPDNRRAFLRETQIKRSSESDLDPWQ